jgi:hypothetical protein
MTKVKFIADGENAEIGKFSKGEIKTVADGMAKVLIDRDKVAEQIKEPKMKVKEEVKKDGGE